MQDPWRAYLEMALGLTEAPRKKAQQVVGELVNRGGATAVQLQGLVEDLMSTGLGNREALTTIVRYEVDRALGVVGLATADEVSDLTGRVRELERQLRDAQARVTAAEGAASVAAAAPDAPVVAVSDAPRAGRLDKPAPTPAKGTPSAKVAKKALKKAAPATPNAMPAAATDVVPPRKAGNRPAAAKPAVVAPAAVPGAPAGPSAPARKAPLEKPPAKSAPAKSVPAQMAVATKAPAKEAPAKKAPAKSAPDSEAAAKKAVAKKAVAKKAVAKKAVTKKAVAKNVVAKKSARPATGGAGDAGGAASPRALP